MVMKKKLYTAKFFDEHRALKKLEFQLALWTSSSQILLVLGKT